MSTTTNNNTEAWEITPVWYRPDRGPLYPPGNPRIGHYLIQLPQKQGYTKPDPIRVKGRKPAHQIVAVPELIEVCEAIVNHYGQFIPGTVTEPIYVQKARDVLAKIAQGVQPND